MIQVAPAASPGAPAGDAELPGVASTSEPIVASDSNAVGASGASSRVTADEGEAKAPPTNGEDTGLVKEVTSMFSAGMTRVDRVVGGPANGIGTGKRRRRACRLCSCLCIMITAFLIYLLSVIASNVEQTVTYDPNNELALQVRGCDVNVKRGSAFEVTIKRWLGSKSSHAVTFNTAGTHAVNIVADNQGACDALFFECHQICSVTITTNVNSADVPKLIYVVQRSDDTADHISVTVQPGVHLGSFRTDGPTARVTVQDAQFDGTLTVRGVGAPVFVQNSVFVGADLRATKGSVYLIDTKPMSRSLALSYRTTSSNMCLAARSNSVSVVEAPTWNPDPAPWSRCSLDLTWWGLQAVNHYDANKDFYITSTEFTEGIAKLPKCCGSACPFRSLCGATQQLMFPTSTDSGQNTVSGRSGIVTDGEFLSRLKALNDTSLVPNCLADVQLEEQGAAAVNVKIIADEIRVETAEAEAWPTPAKPTNSKEGTTINTTFWSPRGAIPGIRLLKNDADRLTAELRDKFGQTGQTGDVFAIIDVADSPGVPAGRWVYTTRPIFLKLDPAILRLISGGLLTPPVQQYRVRFVNTECNENATRYDEDGKLIDLEQRNVAIFQQLSTALTPRFQLEMRGVLVRIEDDHRPPPRSRHMTIYETDFSSGEVRDVRFSTGNDKWADVAVYLSIGIGIFIALFASAAFLMYAKAALAKKEKADAIKQRILDLQIQARTGVKVVRNQTEEEKLNEKSMSPLEQPLELIELLIMNPLRRQMVDSLSTFVRERCKVIQRPSKAELAERAGTMNTDPRTPAKPTAKVAPLTSTSVVQVDGEDDDVTMDEFVEAYSRFCYKLDLREVQDRRRIQQRLIMEHDIRVKSMLVERLRGLRWKAQYASPEARKALAAHLQQEAIRFEGLPAGATGDPPADEEFMHKFAETYCDLTGDVPNDYLEISDQYGIPGFQRLFEQYMESKGWEPPSQLDDHMVETTLRCRVIRRRVYRIVGLQFLDFSTGARSKLGCKWYTMELMTVLMDMLIFYLLPIVIIYIAIDMQYMYAFTTAPTAAVTFFDVMGEFPPDFEGKHVMLLTEIIVAVMFSFMGLATLRLVIYYMDFKARIVQLVIRKAFAVLLTLWIFGAFAYFGMVMMWFLLAAILDPTKYLPYGAAVATVGVVVWATWSAMVKAARVLRERMKTSFRTHMQKTMKRARAMLMQQERLERKIAAGGTLRRRATGTEAGTAEATAKAPEEAFDVGDIFQILNADGDAVLTEKEFSELFRKLQINVPKRKQEQMFAFCDSDNSGTVSQEEFAESWGWVEEQMILEAAEEAGVDDAAIVVAIVSLLLLLAAVFSFIFVAIRAWNNQGSFDAVVQSFLVVASGKVTTLAQKKPKSAEELDDLVDDVVSGAPEAAEPVPSL